MQNTELPPYDAFYSKLRICNLLESKYTDYVNLLKSRLTTAQAVIKPKLLKPPPTGIENYHYLQQIWKQELMSSFRDLLRWNNKKRCCANFGGNAKNDCFLPRRKYRYVEAWLYITKLG